MGEIGLRRQACGGVGHLAVGRGQDERILVAGEGRGVLPVVGDEEVVTAIVIEIRYDDLARVLGFRDVAAEQIVGGADEIAVSLIEQDVDRKGFRGLEDEARRHEIGQAVAVEITRSHLVKVSISLDGKDRHRFAELERAISRGRDRCWSGSRLSREDDRRCVRRRGDRGCWILLVPKNPERG